MTFDIKTIYLSSSILSFILATSLIVVLSNNKNRYFGIKEWIFSIYLISLGSLLIMLRNQIPALYSIFFANAIIFVALLFMIRGFARFMGIVDKSSLHVTLLVLFLGIFYYFSMVQVDLMIRHALVGVGAIYSFGFILYYIFFKIPQYFRPMIKFFELVVWLFVLSNGVRVVLAFLIPSENNDLLANLPQDVASSVIMLVFSILLPISFLLLINNRALDEISLQESKFENAFYDSPVMMLITKLSNGLIHDVNHAFLETFGAIKSDVIGKTTVDLGVWLNHQSRVEMAEKLKVNGHLSPQELTFRKFNGEEIETLYQARIIKMLGEEYIISLASDITEIGSARKELTYMATHDALTGLINRHELNNHFLKLSKNRNATSFSLIMIDLDRFKFVNDIYGHDFGDKVLKQVADFLQQVFKNDFVARLGGDEFIVLLKDDKKETDLIKKMMKFRQIISKFNRLDNKVIDIGASLGYAIYPDEGTTLEALIQNADLKMYEEKTSKRR